MDHGIAPFGLRNLARACPSLRGVKNAKRGIFSGAINRYLPLFTATLLSALKTKTFGVGSGRIWSAKEHLNSDCGLRNRYVLPCIVRVFNGVHGRVES